MTREPVTALVPVAPAGSLAEVLDQLGLQPSELEDLVALAIRQRTPFEVLDVWEQKEAALTYWVLLLTGVNQEPEMQIAKELLAWQAFFAKDAARISCIQSSEQEPFRCCSRQFDILSFPALVVSDRPEMTAYIKFDPALLRSLGEEPGGLQRFFAKLQASFENGMSLQQVQQSVSSENFWRGAKVVYKEIKGLISIKIG